MTAIPLSTSHLGSPCYYCTITLYNSSTVRAMRRWVLVRRTRYILVLSMLPLVCTAEGRARDGCSSCKRGTYTRRTQQGSLLARRRLWTGSQAWDSRPHQGWSLVQTLASGVHIWREENVGGGRTLPQVKQKWLYLGGFEYTSTT